MSYGGGQVSQVTIKLWCLNYYALILSIITFGLKISAWSNNLSEVGCCVEKIIMGLVSEEFRNIVHAFEFLNETQQSYMN